MPALIESLNVINVASPCPANWDDMSGDDRRRFCGQCNLHVYNLSDMSEADALELVNAAEGRLCVRFFRRQDGTMLTRDCPVGLRAVRMKLARMWTSAAAMFGAMTLSSLFGRDAASAEPAKPVVDAKALVEHLGGCKAGKTRDELLRELGAGGILKLLQTARERDANTTGGMPDPLDPDVILESERQSLENRISAKDWKCPTPGTKEHDQLHKELVSVLKGHADLVAPFLAISLVAPTPDAFGPVILGRLKAPDDRHIEDLIRRVTK